MVSIKDIAKKAGVAISTVSYALNGSPKVTEETRAKILEAAKELNYIPNAAARTLKKRNTNIIGAFFTDYGGSFFGELLKGMRKALNDQGYDLIACTGKDSHRFLPEGIIDGAIILDAHFSDKELLSYAERGHRLVVLDRELDHKNIERVLLDNRMGTKLAIEYLIENGHENIILLTGPPESFDSLQRLNAAMELLKEFPTVKYTIIQGEFDRESGKRAAREITEKYERPVAVFSFNDEMAIGMYHFLANTDLRIGEHIQIISFDNIELSRFVHPALTSIHYSKEEWGEVAANQLLQLIQEEKTEPQIISVQLIERDSVMKNKI